MPLNVWGSCDSCSKDWALEECCCCGSEVTRWMWNCDSAVQCVRPLHCGCSAVFSGGCVTSASSLCVSLCAHPPSCSSSDPASSRTGQQREGSGHLGWLWCIALCYIKMTPVTVPGDGTDFTGIILEGGESFSVLAHKCPLPVFVWLAPSPTMDYIKPLIHYAKLNTVSWNSEEGNTWSWNDSVAAFGMNVCVVTGQSDPTPRVQTTDVFYRLNKTN